MRDDAVDVPEVLEASHSAPPVLEAPVGTSISSWLLGTLESGRLTLLWEFSFCA